MGSKLYSANRKSTNSLGHSAIANPHISFVCQSANCKSANFYDRSANCKCTEFKKKFCTTLSQNSPKSHLFKRFFLLCTNLNQSIKCHSCKQKKYVLFVDLQKFKSANHKKIVQYLQIANSQVPHLRRVCKSIKFKFYQIKVRKFADLRILFEECPPLMHIQSFLSKICKNIISFTGEVSQHSYKRN
jgi:hypothetical protein